MVLAVEVELVVEWNGISSRMGIGMDTLEKAI